ncbi:hypothetical protein FAK_01220 [Desulfoferula mesophila]|uniref:DUF2147 domain-containing protein n=2 Tax=Desulfoferula mesophila TaxID=3058419 RepID=A0AAU9ER14_9BACT|nr:hypothetical protein FAK_01220 [Desulfoferula mesophilus]
MRTNPFKLSGRLFAASLAMLALFIALPTTQATAKNLKPIVLANPESLGTVISGEKGLIKIATQGPCTVCLAVVKDLDVDNCLLVYQAEVKTKNLKGKTFLEMWCHFPGKGDYFSRGMQKSLSGDSGWTMLETPFLLQSGQTPSQVTLSLAIAGAGEVWIRNPGLSTRPRR